jgi:hypothetical protein
MPSFNCAISFDKATRQPILMMSSCDALKPPSRRSRRPRSPKTLQLILIGYLTKQTNGLERDFRAASRPTQLEGDAETHW